MTKILFVFGPAVYKMLHEIEKIKNLFPIGKGVYNKEQHFIF